MRFGLICAAMLVFTAGCGGGGGEDQVPVFEVSGKVTNAGAPLANAAVTFSPKGDQPVATGKTDAKGMFKLTTYEYEDGAAEGDYTVMVSKVVEKADDTPAIAHDITGADAGGSPVDSHSGQGAKTTKSVAMANPRYSSAGSPLEATVKADGENNFDFPLEP